MSLTKGDITTIETIVKEVMLPAVEAMVKREAQFEVNRLMRQKMSAEISELIEAEVRKVVNRGIVVRLEVKT